MAAVVAANHQGGRTEVKPPTPAPQAATAWSIPEIRVIKDDQGRLRIDQTDPATYGAYAACQLLATAAAEPKFREGMTKRPSTPTIKITYVNAAGDRREIRVREIFCRMDGDALVLTKFETADGQKVKDLPIAVPQVEEPEADLDDLDRLHGIVLAEFGDAPSPRAEIEPEQEAPPPEPVRERRRPSGPLRQYDEAASPAPAAGAVKTPSTPEPARAVQQGCRLHPRRPCRRLPRRRWERPPVPRPIRRYGRRRRRGGLAAFADRGQGGRNAVGQRASHADRGTPPE